MREKPQSLKAVQLNSLFLFHPVDWRFLKPIGGRLAVDWRAIFRQSVRVNKRSVSGKWELKNIGKKGNRERERGGGVLLLLLFIQLAGDFSFLFSLVGFFLYYKNLPIGFQTTVQQTPFDILQFGDTINAWQRNEDDRRRHLLSGSKRSRSALRRSGSQKSISVAAIDLL